MSKSFSTLWKGIMGILSSKEFMRSAIKAANKLRNELERRGFGACTVAPHAGLQGGVVSLHMSDGQAERLSEMVKQHRSPVRHEWLDEFYPHHASDGSGDIVIGHWLGEGTPCPDKWEHRFEGNTNEYLAVAYEHLEVCGK